MPRLTISDAARQAGLRPSAIRYYERRGVLPPSDRVGGQRRFDARDLDRLALLQWARRAGFSLADIRTLFSGLEHDTPLHQRWQRLVDARLTELAKDAAQIREQQRRLLRMRKNCRCPSPEVCGQALRRAAPRSIDAT